MFNPVQPGEPMHRNMTAKWFNQTLPQSNAGQTNQPKARQLPPGTLECVINGGTPERFKPIALDSVETNNNIDYTPRVSISNLDEYNWGVVQTETSSTIEVCFWGLCLATVHQVNTNDKLVTYSVDNSRLETSNSGKAQLQWYNSTGPSLISIGTPGKGDILFRFSITGTSWSASFDINADIVDMVGNAVESSTISDPEEIFTSLSNGNTGLCIKQGGIYYAIQARCA